MKILVAIANYGTKNEVYARQLIDEYQSMPFEVDIVVLSETSKDYGNNVRVLVGLPTKNPWSLPFGHKKLFAAKIDQYDIFIFTEDDTLMRTENILSFVEATKVLPDHSLPGFVRYELYPNGRKNYLDMHGPYHWIAGSVEEYGEYVFAQFSNDHSACYILTSGQLRKAIESGGFLVPPHSGRYDLICSAGTDPYTQCGFRKVVCISHLSEFELHHLPNAYLNRLGLDEDECTLQIEALLRIMDRKMSDLELFCTQKPVATPAWDKDYYEECRDDIVNMIPDDSMDILSVGCGCGATEAQFLKKGKRVVAIPLDAVIGKVAEKKGITVLPPDFGQAFDALIGSKFDVIVLPELIQHLADPINILLKMRHLLRPKGVLVGSVPNLNLIRRIRGRLFAKDNRWAEIGDKFSNTMLNLTDVSMIRKLLIASNFQPVKVIYQNLGVVPRSKQLAFRLPQSATASNILFMAERTLT